MKITIVRMRETSRYVRPGEIEQSVVVEYKTGKGYEGSITLPKIGFTEKKAWAAVKRDAEAQDAMLGIEKEV